jgi:NTE family protein
MLERLQNTTICKGLAHEEVRRVAAMVRLHSYSSGATVCRQGESGSSMFIVASGRVCATVAVPGDLTPRFIDYRGPGDHFGEMALIGGGRRTATIETVADSELLELDRSAFQELLGEVPRFAANLLATLSARLEHQTSRIEPKRRARSVALLNSSAITQGLLAPLVATLLDESVSLQVFSDRTTLDPIQDDPRCTFTGLGEVGPAEDAVATLRVGLAAGLRNHKLSLVDLLESETGDELPALLSQCEEIWWLADTRESGERGQQLRRLMDRHPEISQRLRWVWVLGEQERYAPPASSDASIQRSSLKVFLAENPETSSRRQHRSMQGLVHQLLGTRIGIALSGGAARGLAHFGALRALENRGIHVDLMAGTSCGAYVAALHCAGWDPAEALEATVRELDPSRFLRSIPRGNEWYIMMMFRLGRWNRFLHTILEDPLIEQLPTPLSTVAVDLVSGRRVVRETGSLVDSIVESTNLPILSRPISSAGSAIVDGAVLDNLPLDLLPERGADVVIGFDVTKFSEGFSGDGSARNRRPGMLKSAARIYELQQRQFSNQHREAANVVVEIDASEFRFSDFLRGREIAEAGEVATQKAMPEIEQAIADSRRAAAQ